MTTKSREALRERILATFTQAQIKSLLAYIMDRCYTEYDSLREYTTEDLEIRNLFHIASLGSTKPPYPERTLSLDIEGFEAAAFGPKEELPRIGADPRYILAVRAIALWRVSGCADPGASRPRSADGGPG